MAVRTVPINEYTKDGRKWIFDVRHNGKRYKSGKYLTKKEAQEAEREFFKEKDKVGKQSMVTLGELFNDHYNYQLTRVKQTTLTGYSKMLKYFDSLKDIKLDELTNDKIEEWISEINKKKIATKTKNGYMKYLKSVINFGIKRRDYELASLYRKIDNFKNPNELPKEMLFYTYEEFQKFIGVEKDLKYKTLFETLYYCGLRRGELRGLTWKSVDFDRKEIRVVYNVVNEKGEDGYWLITSPKTKSSVRNIPIPSVLLKDLESLKEKNKMYYGFKEDWFVFGDVSPIHTHTLRMRKKNNAKEAGVKEIRLHDFRHSCASLLINNGANVVMVAKYLGHSKIDETLNTYSHMFRNKLDEIVNIIDKLNG